MLLATAWHPSIADADGGAEIRWSAPAACPDRAAFVAQLDEFLGISVDSLDSVYIEVRIEQNQARWTLAMMLRVGVNEGERAFDGADCAELVSSAAISAALSLDPNALEQEPDRRRGIQPVWDGEQPPDIRLGTKEPEAPIVRPPPTALPLEASMRVLIGADANGMPETAVAVGAMVGLQMWRVRVEGGAMYWPTQTRHDILDSGINVSRLVGRVAACYRYAWSQLCGIAEFGRVTFESFGYTDLFGNSVDAQLASEFDWGGGGAAAVALPMRKDVSFRVDAEVVVGGVRPSLVVPSDRPMDPPKELYQRGFAVYRLFAGVEVVIR